MESPGRGTDRSTEERRVRPRETDATGRLLTALYYGGGEVIVLASPALLFAVAQPSQVLVSMAAGVAVLALTATAGLVRVGALPGRWPRVSGASVFVRLVLFNLAVGAAAALAPATGGQAGAALLGAVAGVAGAAAVPPACLAVRLAATR